MDYDPDATHVVGGLPDDLRGQVERSAARLADAAGVKYLGDPPVEDSGISSLQVLAETPWMVWYVERRRLVLVTRVQHWAVEG